MAEDPHSGTNLGQAYGRIRLPEPSTALRILELMRESGAEEWACWLRAPLARAVSRGDECHYDVISAIATRHPETIHQTDPDSEYVALHHAARHNEAESIDALVEAGASVERKNGEGCTAVHVAAATAGCETAVAALLRHDADKEQAQHDALTRLLGAVGARNEAAAAALMEAGASLSGGGEALHWEAWFDNAPAIDFLVEMGAHVEAKCVGSTPSHIAVSTAGNLSAILALAWHGTDVNARRSNGDTPLHAAATNFSFESSPATVQALFQAGADETMVNDASETPADVLERTSAEFETGEEGDMLVEQIRKMLAIAPADRADRAWVRRRLVMMCRAFPDRVRLTSISSSSPAVSSTTKSLSKKAALRKSCDSDSSDQGEGSTGSDFSGAMGGLIGLQPELFRTIVEFL
eukprot:g12980.t1